MPQPVLIDAVIVTCPFPVIVVAPVDELIVKMLALLLDQVTLLGGIPDKVYVVLEHKISVPAIGPPKAISIALLAFSLPKPSSRECPGMAAFQL